MARGRGRFHSWTAESGEEPNHSRKSILVWCSHGVEGGDTDFVQSYRYDITVGRWGPADHTAEGRTYVKDSGGDPSVGLPPLFGDGRRYREHFNARCKKCRRLVAMQADRAQDALTWLSDRDQTNVPLSVLQRAYNEVPRSLR